MNFGLVPDDSPLNYDEWRRFLGLPEVPDAVKSRARLRHLVSQAWIQVVPAWTGVVAALGPAIEQFTIAAGRWTIARPGGKDPFQPEPSTVQQRALPCPATTPPMWANNPTKTRRKR